MKQRNFTYIDTHQGVRLRAVVEGHGPLVVLVHGWPESWYAYRHQIDALVQAGMRVAALDMRGCGGSDKPEAQAAYTLRALSTDVAAVIDALGGAPAVLVGHAEGAAIAWATAILYRSKVRAVVGMSEPHRGCPPHPLNDLYSALWPERFFHAAYFQKPGVAERELDADIARTLRKTFYGASGADELLERAFASYRPKRSGFLDGLLDPPTLPAWLSEGDLAYCVEQLRAAGGFGSSLQHFRNSERDFRDLAELSDAVVQQPALFIVGERDPVLDIMPGLRSGPCLERFYADLRGKVFVPGVGRWLQQEAPTAVNHALLGFLAGLTL
ncbi:MAG: hypothetical protein RL701_2702 [Pseudomonadota bacterium]|jgi:pimeloyl-ACP methyl ester carboxylesterase